MAQARWRCAGAAELRTEKAREGTAMGALPGHSTSFLSNGKASLCLSSCCSATAKPSLEPQWNCNARTGSGMAPNRPAKAQRGLAQSRHAAEQQSVVPQGPSLPKTRQGIAVLCADRRRQGRVKRLQATALQRKSSSDNRKNSSGRANGSNDVLRRSGARQGMPSYV